MAKSYLNKLAAILLTAALILSVTGTIGLADVAGDVSANVENLSSTSATIIFKVENAQVTDVEFKLDGKPVTSSGRDRVELRNLTPGTTYSYSAVVYYQDDEENNDSVSVSSASFTTKSAASVEMGSITVAKDTSNSANASVTANFTANGCKVLDKSVFYVSPSTSISSKNIYSNRMSATLTGLSDNQTYTVEAVLYFEDDNGTEKSVSSKTTYTHSGGTKTKPTVSFSTPTYSLSGSNATISAAATVSSKTDSVTNAGFIYATSNRTLELGASGVSTHTVSNLPIPSNTNNRNISANIGGFSPGNTVYIRAFAVSNAGTTYSDTRQVKIENASASVETLTASSIKDNTATVQINVANAGSGISQRGVIVSTSSNKLTSGYVSTNEAYRFVASGTSTGKVNVSLTGLEPNTTYYYNAYVVSSNGGGYTYAPNYRSFKTTSNSPSVTTSSVSNITNTSADVSINVTRSGSSTITERGVVYSTSSKVPTTSDTTKKASGTSTGSASVSLTGLTANKTYYVRAYVKNSYGTSYGEVRTFTTTSSTGKTPTVKTGTVRSTSNTSADVTIDVTSIGGSNITERGVVYSATSKTPTTSDSLKKATGTATGTTTITLTGLTKDKTYYVRAYAKNSYGTAYGEVKTLDLTNGTVPSVTTYSANDITSTTADIEINVANTNGADIIERGIVYSATNTMPEINSTKTAKETIFGQTGRVLVMLADLDKGTKYYARAYARSANGYGYGEVITFTTKTSDNLPKVSTVSTSIENDRSVDVKINVTSNGGSSITERGLLYSSSANNIKKGASGVTAIKSSDNDTGSETLTIGNVNSGTIYVRAYAVNRNGTTYGQVKEVVLDKTGVTTAIVSDIKNNSATAGGSISSSMNSSVKERGVVYSASRQTPTIDDLYQTSSVTSSGSYSVQLSQLQANQKYYVRAYAKMSSGYVYGDTVSFTTGGSAYLTVLYELSNGTRIGTQSISVDNGQVVKANNLNVPSGYRLNDPVFSYTGTGASATVSVIVASNSVPFIDSMPNYRFEPSRKATRLEVAKMIYALSGKPSATATRTYSDVAANQTDKAAIDYVTAMGFMTGYPDGSFKPERNISRGEVAVICTTVYGIAPKETQCPYSDTNNHWSSNYVTAASEYGAIAGYPDGTFRPNNNINRAEMCMLFSKAEKRDLAPLGTTQFTDVPSNHWAYQAIMNASVPAQ